MSRASNGLWLAGLAAVLLLYGVVSVRHLATVPPVYEDEPGQASTGWKLATTATFGSDPFTGFHGMERRYYGFLPLHPLLLAATFRVAGLGLVQARLEAVVMGALILGLTAALGWRLFGPAVGVLAALLLVTVRLTGLTRSHLTGIPLLDMARIARYDMVVGVFGLAALHAYLSAARRPGLLGYALAGCLAGLAGLSHLYGVFWLAVLGLLALWDGAGGRRLAALALGFAVPWIPYLAYVLADVPAWIGQTRGYGPRFELFNPAWYWSNLLREPHRYGPGLGPPGLHRLARIGVWAALVVVPLSLMALATRARREPAARALLVPALVLPGLFALLIHLKLLNYLVNLAPLGALVAAWGGVTLWRWAGRQGWALRAALLALLVAITAEGATRVGALERAAAATTPYADFIARVRAHVPPGARVLGLHDYWFGLDDRDFRTWTVPLLLSDPRFGPQGLTLDDALETLAPDVILIDAKMRRVLAGTPAYDGPVREWMARHAFRLVAIVDDPTYGAMAIYQRP
jgi:hypothetical protein